MPEDLQNLLNRIQKDGVQKAEAEADRIVSEAKQKAGQIEQEAHDKAGQIVEKAEKEAEAFAENSRKSVKQAARDIVLSVEESIQKMMQSIMAVEINDVLDEKGLREMLGKFVEGYFSGDKTNPNVEILLNPEDLEKLKGHFTAEFKKAMSEGLDLTGEGTVVSGFRVYVKDEQVEHDFSRDAIVESLSRLLRPHIAELVKASARNHES